MNKRLQKGCVEPQKLAEVQPLRTWRSRSKMLTTGASLRLLSLTVVLLSASAAQAANFSFGDKATVALFRGAGGLLGSSSSSSGSSGIDELADRINDSFSDYALTTRVFDSYEGNVFDFREVGSDRAVPFLNSLPNVNNVGLVGYSAGGLSAIRTAKKRPEKPVSLLVQVESYEPLTGWSNEDEVLPDNVRTGINYYQERNRFNVFRPGRDVTDLQGAQNVRGSQNINAEELLGDRSITHRSIIKNDRLQRRIVQDIQENLLNDLAFDRDGKLNLGRGAEATRNIVRLTPGGQSRSSDAALSESVSSKSSFQSRLEFRLPFETISEGLAFWVGPSGQPESSDDQLTLKIDPLLPSESIQSNKLLLLTPGQGADSENSPFALNGSDPITAWMDYDSDQKRYEVFLSNSANKPEQPIFSRNIDLSALGDRTYFGLRAAGSDDGQYADLLSWILQTTDDETAADSSASPLALLESDAAPAFLSALTASEPAESSSGWMHADANSEQVNEFVRLGLVDDAKYYSALLPEASYKSVPEPRIWLSLALVSGGFLLTRPSSFHRYKRE